MRIYRVTVLLLTPKNSNEIDVRRNAGDRIFGGAPDAGDIWGDIHENLAPTLKIDMGSQNRHRHTSIISDSTLLQVPGKIDN